MVDWKRNAEVIASECQSKEEAFLSGVSFAIGYFRKDLAMIKPEDMRAALGVRDHLQVLKRERKEES